MGEEDTGREAENEDQDESENDEDTEQSGTESENEESDDTNGDDDAEGEDAEGDESGESDEDDADKSSEKGGKKKTSEGGEDDEPPTRGNKDAVIRRLQAKRDKLTGKTPEGTGKPADKGKEGEQPDQDQEFAERFERVVGVSPTDFRSQQSEKAEKENEAELDKFFSSEDNKDFKPDEARIRKWWKHPSRNHLPITTVAYEVSGKRLMKLGALKGREADRAARQTGASGHSGRSAGGKKSLLGMSAKEREAEISAVKQSGRE